MKAQLIAWIASAWHVLLSNSHWMTWNLLLAFVPLALSVWLFRSRSRLRSWLWWVGFVIFVIFLPNAPYVLTDIIHLIQDVRANYSVWLITLALIPQYLLFIVAGFEAYVLSLINLGDYLKRWGWGKAILWAELILHGLSAIGIYLGRFKRFNSWDIVTQLDTLTTSVMDDLVGKRPLLVITVTFVVIAGLYWLLKEVSLAILTYKKHSKSDLPRAEI